MPAEKTNRTTKNKTNFSAGKLIFYIIALLLFILAAYYATTIKNDLRLFREENTWWLSVAVVSQFLTYAGGALIYSTLFFVFGAKPPISRRELFQATFVTLFLNQVLPGAGLSGNAYFFQLLVKRHYSPAYAILLILIELLTFYVAFEFLILLILIAGSVFFQLPFTFRIILIAGFAVYFVFALGISLTGKKGSIGRIYNKLMSFRWVRKQLNRIRASLPEEINLSELQIPWPSLFKNRSRLLMAVALQTGIFLFDSFTIYALFHGLGVRFPYISILTGLILTRIISLLPVAPGALVLYESSMTFFYVSLGASVSVSVIVTLLYRVLSFWMPMPIGFILYRKLRSKGKG